jgi:ABC-type phosphate/phosphonate transport system substrate-binding protein
MTIASLPMYDLPELHAANDALWGGIASRLRARGIDAPVALTRGADLMAVWNDTRLLLAQTCGYPLVTTLAGRVGYLATPRYNAPGCDGPLYRSALIVRATDRAGHLRDLRGRTCAINDPASNSGMNVLRAAVAPLAGGETFFSNTLPTGSHAASAEAVAAGEADLAAVDCVTWAHLQRHRPAITRRLRVLSWSAATPGLPLITAIGTGRQTAAWVVEALAEVGHAPALGEAREALRLDGFVVLPIGAYDEILRLEHEARGASYPELV